MDLGGKYSTNLTHWKNGVAIEIHRENYEILLWCKLHRKEEKCYTYGSSLPFNRNKE